MSEVKSFNKGGRPAKNGDEKRIHNVVFRLTEAELSEFKKIFKDSSQPTIRKFLMDSYMNKKTPAKISAADIELFNIIKTNVKDIHLVASNVNQIAAKINSMKGDVSETILGYELKKTLTYLSEMKILEEKIVEIASLISDKTFNNDSKNNNR